MIIKPGCFDSKSNDLSITVDSSSHKDSTISLWAKICKHKVMRGPLGQNTILGARVVTESLSASVFWKRGINLDLGSRDPFALFALVPTDFHSAQHMLTEWPLCAAFWCCSNRYIRACFVMVSPDWRQMLQVLKSVFRESLYCLMVCLTAAICTTLLAAGKWGFFCS